MTLLQADKLRRFCGCCSLSKNWIRCRGQYFKKLAGSEDIWEVRVQFGSDIFRLLGFFESGSVLVLTNGFSKKTQKTPPQEIALAIRRKHEYLARKKNDE